MQVILKVLRSCNALQHSFAISSKATCYQRSAFMPYTRLASTQQKMAEGLPDHRLGHS